MRLPTFIIAGVQKAGTSSVYHYLKQHPQIYMSPVKEPNFLAKDWAKFYAEGGTPRTSRIDTLEEYAALFEAVTDESAIGEASVNYLFNHQTSVAQIHKIVPQAQILIILRHPAERAYSDFLMHLRDSINPDSRRALAQQIKQRAHASHTIRKGLYCEGIQHFQQIFGPEQVHVFLYDDLKKSAVTFMQTMYATVGVDADFEPNMALRSQTAQVPKNQTLNRLLRKQNPLRSLIAGGLKFVLSEQRRQALRANLIQLNSAGKQAVPLTPADRAALIDFYREDILQLQDLLQRDLSAWLV